MVLVIEPDSLPNLASNLEAFPACGDSATQAAYKGAVSYAVGALKGKKGRLFGVLNLELNRSCRLSARPSVAFLHAHLRHLRLSHQRLPRCPHPAPLALSRPACPCCCC